MSRFRKKPVEVEAVQHAAGRRLPDGFLRDDEHLGPRPSGAVEVRRDATVGKQMVAYVTPGHWLIRNPDGSFVTCPPAVFEATYEPASSDTEPRYTLIEIEDRLLAQKAVEAAKDELDELRLPPGEYMQTQNFRVRRALRAALTKGFAHGAEVHAGEGDDRAA